jgi:uncharacterized membrane protein YraQ (UPF0718 family)
MLPLLLAAMLPVALGAGLALGPGLSQRWRGPATAFAVAVALSVVLNELLPHAGETLGPVALGLFALGLVGPGLLERIGGRLASGRRGVLGAELGFGGLVLHQVLDGVQIGGSAQLGESAWGVALAVAAHSVPLIAAVTLGFARRDGTRKAGLRAVVLVAVTGLGTGLGGLGTALLPEQGLAWVSALVGGLLLHVLWHDLWESPPETPLHRGLELAAFGLGFALPVFVVESHAEHAEHLGQGLPFIEQLQHMIIEVAPLVLGGVLLGALVRATWTGVSEAWVSGRSEPLQALRGLVLGAPLPLTACSLLPVAERLRQRRASAALVLAFLLMAPQLGLEALGLGWGLMGWRFTLLRLGVAALSATAGALVLASQVGRAAPIAEEVALAPSTSLPRRALVALDETLVHVLPWVLVGLAVAAAVQTFVPDLGGDSWLQTGLVAVLSLPLYVCGSGATPVAGVLWQKGLASPAVMALLVLGPGMNLASLAFLARAYGRRAMLLSIGAFVVVGLAGSVALAWLLPAAPLDLPVLHPLLTHLSALVLLTLLVRSLWQAGPRAWLAVLGDLGGPGTGHDHRHDHSHGHEHGHGHGHLERAPSADLDPIEAAHAGERAHDHAHQHDEDP